MRIETLVTGLAFPEGPRWHAGALWFSDMHAHTVLRWDGSDVTEIAHVPGGPSGLGFLDAATLLVSSQHDRRVLRVDVASPPSEPSVHADLSALATWHLNDLITDSMGRAYVGNYGSGAPPGEPIAPADLVLVDTAGSSRVVARELYFPNGMALSKDGQTLTVAETRSEPGRLTVFDVGPDGGLSGRRTLIEFPTQWPDGITMDAEGAVWVASPFSGEVLRVSVAGEIVDSLEIDNPYAVALGGPDGRDLFVCTSGTWLPDEAVRERSGALRSARVQVPAA